MNFKELHRKYADNDSPTVEGQIRWLQKQGFPQHQIEQAMITVYGEISRGETTFKNGSELDQYLLNVSKKFRTDELTALSAVWEENAAAQEKKWREKWEAENKLPEEVKKPWYKKVLGIIGK